MAIASGLIPTSGLGTLTKLQPSTPPQTLCQLPDPSNYTGRENRLYRVQIHNGGDPAGGGSSFQIALSADAAAGATSVSVATALTRAQIDAASRFFRGVSRTTLLWLPTAGSYKGWARRLSLPTSARSGKPKSI